MADRPDAQSAAIRQVAAVPSSTLTHSQQMALQSFQQSPTAVQCLSTAQKRFLDGHHNLQRAKAQLQMFQSRSGNGTGTKLPASLSLKIVHNLRLPEVPGDASFYKDQIDVLKKLEVDTQKIIYEQIVAARTKHLHHLTQQSNTQAFITREVLAFTQIVSAWADQHDSLVSAAPPAAAAADNAVASGPASDPNAFPRKAAIDSFESSLHQIVESHTALMIQKSIDSSEKQKQQLAADNSAQEQVLGGAHNGQTIEKLASRAAEKHIQPLRKQVLDLQGQVSHSSKRKEHPAPAGFSESTRDHAASSSHVRPWHGGLAYLQSSPSNVGADRQQPKRVKRHNSSSSDFHSGGVPRNTRPPAGSNHDDDADMNTMD